MLLITHIVTSTIVIVLLLQISPPCKPQILPESVPLWFTPSLSDEAKRFYEQFGFQPSPTDPMDLMITKKNGLSEWPRINNLTSSHTQAYPRTLWGHYPFHAPEHASSTQ